MDDEKYFDLIFSIPIDSYYDELMNENLSPNDKQRFDELHKNFMEAYMNLSDENKYLYQDLVIKIFRIRNYFDML